MSKGHDNVTLRHFRTVLVDALRHAGQVAARGQEATQGTSDTLLFFAAQQAISEFVDKHPTMLALADAAVRDVV